jgi:hypothetical protein
LLQEDLAVRECPLKSKDRANLLAGRDFDAATKVAKMIRGRTLRAYVSSTFSDTQCERDLLIEDVYPFLRQLGRCEHRPNAVGAAPPPPPL